MLQDGLVRTALPISVLGGRARAPDLEPQVPGNTVNAVLGVRELVRRIVCILQDHRCGHQ